MLAGGGETEEKKGSEMNVQINRCVCRCVCVCVFVLEPLRKFVDDSLSTSEGHLILLNLLGG